MERYSYPTIAAVLQESTEILYLTDCASYGYRMDEREQAEELDAEIERMRNGG